MDAVWWLMFVPMIESAPRLSRPPMHWGGVPLGTPAGKAGRDDQVLRPRHAPASRSRHRRRRTQPPPPDLRRATIASFRIVPEIFAPTPILLPRNDADAERPAASSRCRS
jgi:hypothetical protein